MSAEVDSPEAVPMIGVSMEFPMNGDGDEKSSPESSPSKKIPRRLRERLEECNNKTQSITVEDIETKLRLADLRRQQFYEKLASKARPKCRSPSSCSSNEDDLGQRLEAKLQAAEQKRLSILENARMRLARLDALRKAAKTGVAMRSEKKRKELGTKVESRVQQAEANRMLLLKAYKQRRATLKERTSQSILRRVARESKYKECVRAAINQKRAAAEKKRLGLLEEEKRRAHARVTQVCRVAKSVSNQREIERRKMKDSLEDRLQKARRQRAELLRQKGSQHTPVQLNRNKMQKQAEFLSRKLARCWRRFRKQKKTTLALATTYDALKVNEKCVKSMQFDQLALLIESIATIQTVKALLDRFESRIEVSRAVSATSNSFNWGNIDHLLKRVASPIKKSTPKNYARSRVANKAGSTRNATSLSRYQVRVVLCAYMILGHPDAVFSGQGELEFSLAKSAEAFVREFELLIKIILKGPIQNYDEEYGPTVVPRQLTFRSQLSAFDKAWCTYLNSFVAWKVKDAKTLEEDLVRAACHLELSMMQTCKLTIEGDVTLTHDMKAVQKQVIEDQKLLREKVQHLSGNDGTERMNCALADTRIKYFQSRAKGKPLGSPVAPLLSSSPSYSVVPSPVASIDAKQKPNRVIRALFSEESSSSVTKDDISRPGTNIDTYFVSPDEKKAEENEFFVNAIVHGIADFAASDVGKHTIMASIKETMDKAFWDRIKESMDQDEPKYDQVFELIKEVRDDLCKMAPQNWKQEVHEAIDLGILSQMLKSGNLDIGYLGDILAFALVTLRRLSAVAYEDEMKDAHQKLLKNLMETRLSQDQLNLTLIKGLRYVLEKIQALKQEIALARVRMMEPILKGPKGLEYLKKCFTKKYGSPSSALTSLPITVQWLSSVWNCKDQEWTEHKDALTKLTNHVFLPSSTLRTGGSRPIVLPPPYSITGKQPECNGERIDLLVRLGLLMLVSGVSGLTQETIPETLKLNLDNLRGVQAQIQSVIVISTSALIFRQILLTEQGIPNPTDMEKTMQDCIKRLAELFTLVEDAGIEHVVETLGNFGDTEIDFEKLRSRKLLMARMLHKSLQAGDPVFERVSRTVYIALRGAVLGGSGSHGSKIAETSLKQIGAASLVYSVLQAAEVLVVTATVSASVHGPWYIHLTDNM